MQAETAQSTQQPSLGMALLVGSLTAFSLTHNPLFQVFTGPTVALIGPFVGGIVAAGRAPNTRVAAIAIAICISLTLSVPVALAWWLLLNPGWILAGLTISVDIANAVGWLAIAIGIYAGLTAYAGVWYRRRGDEKKRRKAEGGRRNEEPEPETRV